MILWYFVACLGLLGQNANESTLYNKYTDLAEKDKMIMLLKIFSNILLDHFEPLEVYSIVIYCDLAQDLIKFVRSVGNIGA